MSERKRRFLCYMVILDILLRPLDYKYMKISAVGESRRRDDGEGYQIYHITPPLTLETPRF